MGNRDRDITQPYNTIKNNNTKNSTYLAIAIGIGFAIKISIFMIAFPVLTSLVISSKLNINYKEFKIYNFKFFMASGLYISLISVFSFCLMNPYSIINFGEFINSSKKRI